MTEAEMLEQVKKALGITGIYQDETIMLYIQEVKEYMRDAGVADEVIDSAAAVGVITRGVSDLWNYGAGDAQLSAYFYQRVTQLKYRG